MKIVKYNINHKTLWDEFVKSAKNSHFFFYRDYMEYHSDRFEDFSLLFFDDKNKLLALLPANIIDTTLHTHQGLTFGGFLIDNKMKTTIMLELFTELNRFLKEKNVKKVIYKCIPYIYHTLPAEEDRYALFMHNAQLFRRDVSSTIYTQNQIKYSKGRKWIINKAKKNQIVVEESENYDEYWKNLEEILKLQHSAKPVHSLKEIIKLSNLFPENIKLYTARKDGELLAGAVLFINKNIVHTQYLMNSIKGREFGALDLVIDRLINEFYTNKIYFDFGISNEDNGRYLNSGLIGQKEGFGARAVAHDFYELEII